MCTTHKLLIAVMCSLLWIGGVNSALLAYYSFAEGRGNVTLPSSGDCFNVVPNGTLYSATNWAVNGYSGTGLNIGPNSPPMNAGGIYYNFAVEGTFMFWTKPPPSVDDDMYIIYKASSLTLSNGNNKRQGQGRRGPPSRSSTNSATPSVSPSRSPPPSPSPSPSPNPAYSIWFSAGYWLNVRFVFAGTTITTRFGSGPLNSNSWTHVAVTFDSDKICAYYNATLVGPCTSIQGTSLSDTPSNPLWIGGNCPGGVSSCFATYTGILDEVSVWSSALSPSTISTFYQSSSTSLISLSISGNPYVQVGQIDSTIISAENFTDGNLLSYQWKQTSGDCGILVPARGLWSDNAVAEVQFVGVGVATVGCCVTKPNGVAQNLYFEYYVSASYPVLTTDLAENYTITTGSSLTLAVRVAGEPAPSIQWQIGFPPNISDSSSSYVEPSSTPSTIPANATIPSASINSTNTTVSSFNPLKQKRQTTSSSSQEEPVDLGNYVWTNIQGATSNVFIINNIPESYDRTGVRAFIANTAGSIFTRSAVVLVNDPIVVDPSGSRGGDGDNSEGKGLSTGAIVGIAVGAAACCLGLCCALLIIGLLLILFVRKSNAYTTLGYVVEKPDFDSLIFGEEFESDKTFKNKNSKNYSALETYLFEQDSSHKCSEVLSLYIALRKNNDEDLPNALRAMMIIAETHHNSNVIVQDLVIQELEQNPKAITGGVVFRASTVSVKTLAAFCRVVGTHYLFTVLAAPVNELNYRAKQARIENNNYNNTNTNGSGGSSGNSTEMTSAGAAKDFFSFSMEVDPSKMNDEATDATINTLELWLCAQKLFKGVTVDHKFGVPLQVIELLSGVSEYCNDKGVSEDLTMNILSNFFWLRFYCPALMSPQSCGALQNVPEATAQRQLILLSKVLQNLANGTLPGNKEKYMERLNQFILDNQNSLTAFYEDILEQRNRERFKRQEVKVDETVRVNSMSIIHEWIYDNVSDFDNPDAKLLEILKDLGDPPQRTRI